MFFDFSEAALAAGQVGFASCFLKKQAPEPILLNARQLRKQLDQRNLKYHCSLPATRGLGLVEVNFPFAACFSSKLNHELLHT